jgi:DNA-binding CsgD family transcriptional regulator
MPRLAKAQQHAYAQIRDCAVAGLPPNRLAARLMSALRAAIPCDGFRMFGIDSRTLLVNRVLASSENDLDPRHEWLREVYLQSGRLSYIDIPTIMRAGITASAMHDRQELCFGFPAEVLAILSPKEHHSLFHELRSPVGGTLFGCFPARGKWVAALQMYRREGHAPFRAGEVSFLKMVAPAIGEAIAASLGREHGARRWESSPHASGIVIMNASGDVTFSTPASEAWLELLKSGGESAHAKVASAVWSARAALLAGKPASGSSSLITPTPAGPARVEASLAGSDGAVAIVISDARPPEPIELPIYWPLTEREREIATLLVHGLDSEQIAERVFLSQSTVDWHLWNVYEKLSVDGRSGLYARFFREMLMPEVEENGGSSTIEQR